MHIDEQANDSAENFSQVLTEILDEVAPKIPIATRRKSVHWWTPQIQQLRKDCNHQSSCLSTQTQAGGHRRERNRKRIAERC